MDALKLRRTPLRTDLTKDLNHLQEIAESDPVDINALETDFEQLKIKSAKLKEIDDYFRNHDRIQLYSRSLQQRI
ncbi:hypothetical protein TNCT_620861 [Trichonephila clavata]|uniref:Uncharacterized protein n=1 Tax=Trichonephila clavata TaxID=2740835 RepID=A0A8X6J1F5_TRICU|nr:hypothetical protein TNCT_620861 [Trichonephila clavata]